jgi:hypothetical protein
MSTPAAKPSAPRIRTGTTFAVSDVTPATAPHQDRPYVEALSERLNGRIEAYSRRCETLIPARNGLIKALHLAFAEHRPLSLSADHIWLLLCQGFANHVNANAETLRGQFVKHEGKLELTVSDPRLTPGNPDIPWQQVIASFSEQIKDHIGAHYDLLAAEFSTTTPIERAAYDIALMDTTQAYFDFAMTLCGIPSITLEGTTEDWTRILERVERFRPFGLDWWIDRITPLLRQFVEASTGKVERDFWCSMFKWESASGGPYITGWISRFIPYLVDFESGRATRRNPYVEVDPPSDNIWAGVSANSLPTGLCSAPVEWRLPDRKLSMRFYGGFVGVTQDGLTVSPEIGWVISEEIGERK